MKNVQIPQELLLDLFAYFLHGDTDEYTERAIVDALEAKLDALIRHQLYTTYKTATTPAAREAARKAYLDEVGMKASYRWPEGWKPEEPPNG